MPEIKVKRDSVCMGDDVFNNSRSYEVEEGLDLSSVMEMLINDHFFASVHGNDVVWSMNLEVTSQELASYQTKKKLIFYTLKDQQSTLGE